ncbi:uncharacterized protein LOC141685922 [Apium graveolens]|uniref:uncharacterized protein LOC141685922 n=1 Tax=Apium graveolens TaxID=4045 RepID=UPI003D7B8A54
MTGRLAAWTIELSQFYIEYKPRTAIRAQVLSDFVAECQFKTKGSDPEEIQPRPWLLFVDGLSTSNSGGAGIILIIPEGFKVQQALKFEFQATNNVAEYEALIAGLKLATNLEVDFIDIFGDSQLVAKQISRGFKTHNESMAKYLAMTQELLKKFSSWKLSNVDRTENQWADSLAKIASSNLKLNLDRVYFDSLKSPVIDMVIVHNIQSNPDWRSPILEYILENKLPTEKSEARAIMFKARNYCTIGSVLYRYALTEPLLRCLSPEEVDQAILEVHTGICGEHIGGKNLALKIMRHGMYWPILRKDCEGYVRKFQGVDIVGPFPKSRGQCQYIVVAVDYATKWVEAKPLSKIREKEMIEFFMEYVVFRFGVPRISVSDNGTQFVGAQFEKVLSDLKIQHIKASVAYPQANGLAEITNRTILQGLKKRIEEIPRCWVDELPNVLWSYRTTPRSATGETPFRLAYGVDAVLPVEVSRISPRIEVFDPSFTAEGLYFHNDLLEETREES